MRLDFSPREHRKEIPATPDGAESPQWLEPPYDMQTADLEYDLPADLIATHPASPRDSARMMVVRRNEPAAVVHAHVRDLPSFLTPPDLLIINDTAVTPARLIGKRIDTGGGVEGLFLREIEIGAWEVMLRSNGRLRVGAEIQLDSPDHDDSSLPTVLRLVSQAPSGSWRVSVSDGRCASDILNRVGLTPLPPYIRRARSDSQFADADDRVWYQTIYADADKCESVAAPTAGLHFTPELLDRLESSGIGRAMTTLHVGAGTFRPITTDDVEAHPMHTERFSVPMSTLEAIDARHAGGDGGRIIAVGTTSVRAIESIPPDIPPESPPDVSLNSEAALHGETDLLITPGYHFQRIDGLLTNFHLPRSTLLALVAALIGLDMLLELYEIAIAERYRFYSYGDCMLILP